MSASISALLGLGQGLDLGVEVAEAVVGVEADLLERRGVLVQGVLVEDGDGVAEQDRIGDLHHRRLEVERQQQALGLGVLDLVGVEGAQGLHAHERPAEDLAVERGQLVLEDLDRAVRALELDPEVDALVHGHGLLVAVEVAARHVGDVGLVVRLPGAQLVGVLLGEVLDRERRPAVGVALAQDRVDGAAQDLGVAGLDLLLGVGLGILGIVGQLVALGLELLDGLLQLRDRGADVRQLDDVGLGRQGQLAQHGQVVGDALGLGQIVGEVGDDAAGERDVAQLDVDARPLGEALDDREKGVGGQVRRLVGLRPVDLVSGHESSFGSG